MSDTTNPLLDNLHNIPGETFRLPSGGLFYKNGELGDDVVDGEVHVYPMRTVDELIMKSPDKLLTGKAVDEVFARCIPDIKKPGELLANDVEYLMVAIRLVSYGEHVELTTTHHCEGVAEEDRKESSYSIDIRDILKQARIIDPTTLDKSYTLDVGGYSIAIRPPRYKSVMGLYQSISEEFLQNAPEDEVAAKLIENLASMVESVNGHSDSEHIIEWLKNIRAGWVNQISDFTRESSKWGVEYQREVKCKTCKEKFEVTVPTNPVTFFT